MLARRIFIGAIFASMFAAPLSAQMSPVSLDEIEVAFNERDANTRKMVQQAMKAAGYYDRAIDGAWGDGMKRAYSHLLASKRYRDVSSKWTWSRNVQVVETLMFLTSDAYME